MARKQQEPARQTYRPLTLRATLGGDEDARYWARTVVEHDGGTVVIELQDGTTFTWPVGPERKP